MGVAALSTIAAASAGAQFKGATVRVRDQNDALVPHALVEIDGGHRRIADDSGRVYLEVTGDSVRLSARRIGYAPFVGWAKRAASGEYTVTLRALAQTLTAVKVVERGAKTPLELSGFYDRIQRAQRGAFNAEFVTPEELEARMSARTSDLFQGRRFIKVTRAPNGKLFLLGRGNCPMTVFVDGMMQRPTDVSVATANVRVGTLAFHGAVTIDDYVSANSIAGIEMYSSAAQAPVELIPLVGTAEYGSCGVVAIWTGGRR